MVMGETSIHEDVFREIARLVLEEVEGIYSYESKGPLASILGEKSVKPQISVIWPDEDDDANANANAATGAQGEGLVSYEIRLAALYGASIPRMVETIRAQVAEKVEAYTGYKVVAVDVYITKLIRFTNERGTEDDDTEADSDNQDARYPEFGDGR